MRGCSLNCVEAGSGQPVDHTHAAAEADTQILRAPTEARARTSSSRRGERCRLTRELWRTRPAPTTTTCSGSRTSQAAEASGDTTAHRPLACSARRASRCVLVFYYSQVRTPLFGSWAPAAGGPGCRRRLAAVGRCLVSAPFYSARLAEANCRLGPFPAPRLPAPKGSSSSTVCCIIVRDIGPVSSPCRRPGCPCS